MGRQDFANALQRTLEMMIADDHDLALMKPDISKFQYGLSLELQRDQRFPSRESVRICYHLPSEKKKWLTVTLLPDQIERESSRNWLVRKVSNMIVRQLKAESLILLQPRLDDDLSKNIVFLDANKKRLEVELLGQSPSSRRSPIPSDQAEELLSKQKPVAERRQPKLGNKVLNFMKSPVTLAKDLKAPLTQEKPRKLAPIDPFHAQKYEALSRQPAFPFPRAVLSGPSSLFMSPSLGTLETDPRDILSVRTSFSLSREDFTGTEGPENINWKGDFLRQHLSISTRLWKYFSLNLDTGYGVRDSDSVRLEMSHPTAPGGTTFLSNRSLDQGLLDSSLTLTYVHDMKRFLFRPFVHVKLPTGEKESLLSSGSRDMGAGVSIEWNRNSWHLKSLFSVTSPGDLEIFIPSQGSLAAESYITASIGLGRTINLFGGERASMSLTAQQNPLRENANLDELNKDLLTLAAMVEKDFFKHTSFRLEGSAGLTDSSPKASILFGVQQNF